MQSSTAVVFRALVMLACLVAIPLAAVVGKSLPDMVRGLVGGQWPGRSAFARGSLAEAPRFQPGVSPGAPSELRTQAPSRDWPQPQFQEPQPASSRSIPPTTQPVIQAGYQSLAGQATGARAAGWPSSGPAGEPRGVRPAALPFVSTDSGRSANATSPRQSSVAAPVAAAYQVAGEARPDPDQAHPATDRFAQIQNRLRQLGATYYLLESWGNRNQLYRFYCKMAVGGNPNYTHYFEATDADPLEAMARVLAEVETWEASRP